MLFSYLDDAARVASIQVCWMVHAFSDMIDTNTLIDSPTGLSVHLVGIGKVVFKDGWFLVLGQTTEAVHCVVIKYEFSREFFIQQRTHSHHHGSLCENGQ